MKTSIRSFGLTLLMAATVMLGGGCAVALIGGAAAGAGTIAYVKGELRSSESMELEQAWAATQAAAQELKIAVMDTAKDGLSANLTGRTSGDKKVHINLKIQSKDVIEIRIRVGTFGDRYLSNVILDKIRHHYKKA